MGYLLLSCISSVQQLLTPVSSTLRTPTSRLQAPPRGARTPTDLWVSASEAPRLSTAGNHLFPRGSVSDRLDSDMLTIYVRAPAPGAGGASCRYDGWVTSACLFPPASCSSALATECFLWILQLKQRSLCFLDRVFADARGEGQRQSSLFRRTSWFPLLSLRAACFFPQDWDAKAKMRMRTRIGHRSVPRPRSSNQRLSNSGTRSIQSAVFLTLSTNPNSQLE